MIYTSNDAKYRKDNEHARGNDKKSKFQIFYGKIWKNRRCHVDLLHL